MNIKYITNKLTLWKDINNFYSFNELINLSKQYYHGVYICFGSTDTIFKFNFYATRVINPLQNKSEIILQTTYNGLLFSKNEENINSEISNDLFFKRYDFFKNSFKKEFKIKILDSSKLIYNPIKKYCLLSELYSNILDGVNL